MKGFHVGRAASVNGKQLEWQIYIRTDVPGFLGPLVQSGD
jgi:hypothetical protein